MQSNPMVQGNPQLSEQLRQNMPHLMGMMSRPEVQRAMSNPRVIEALQQIQRGTETLRREAPELHRLFIMPQLPLDGGPGAPQRAPSSTPSSANNNMAQMMQMMQTAFGSMNMAGAGGAEVSLLFCSECQSRKQFLVIVPLDVLPNAIIISNFSISSLCVFNILLNVYLISLPL